MKTGKIAVVGKFNAALAEQILRDGFEIVFFKDKHHPTRSPATVPVYPIDFSSKVSVLKTLKSLDILHVIGTVAVYESYVPAQHWIAGYYGIPHASEHAIAAATDKRLMRECFKKTPPA